MFSSCTRTHCCLELAELDGEVDMRRLDDHVVQPGLEVKDFHRPEVDRNCRLLRLAVVEVDREAVDARAQQLDGRADRAVVPVERNAESVRAPVVYIALAHSGRGRARNVEGEVRAEVSDGGGDEPGERREVERGDVECDGARLDDEGDGGL
jgi:hypothetical protein